MRKSRGHYQRTERATKSLHAGFTIVELLMIIAVITILAAITVMGIGAWRSRLAKSELSSDLTNLQAGMEDARNRTNVYPVFPSGTEFNGSNSSRSVFRQSKHVRITYRSGTTTAYCVDLESTATSEAYFFDSSSASAEMQEGSCS